MTTSPSNPGKLTESVDASRDAGSATLHHDRVLSSSQVSVQDEPTVQLEMPTDGFADVGDELNHIYQTLGLLPAEDYVGRQSLVDRLETILADPSSRSHDDFANTGGFLVLVQILSSLGKGTSASTSDSTTQRCNLFQRALSIFSQVVSSDTIHLRSFEETVGWSGLASALRVSEIASSAPDHFFGCLFGLAVGEVVGREGSMAYLKSLQHDDTEFRTATAKEWSLPLLHAEALDIIYVFTREQQDAKTHLCLVTEGIVECLAGCSHRNRVAISKTLLPSKLLREALSSSEVQSRWPPLLQSIYRTAGLPDEDGRIVLRAVGGRNSPVSDKCLDLLLGLAIGGAAGNTITFDMSLQGHSSLAFSSIRKPFPPSTASNGWSLFMNIQINQAEDGFPIEVLHVFDAARTSSTKLMIIGQHLQYITRCDIPPLEFKGFRFAIGRLYHLAFAHHRPKGNAKSSLAQLFIDGILVEQQIATWPTAPASSDFPTRVVFGTAPGPSPRADAQIWSMGPAYMMDQCIPDECALLLKELGSTYDGNLQDSLGRFLTYRASTNVNLRLEAMSRALSRDAAAAEKELASHPLVLATAGRHSGLFKEDRFYFAIHSGCTAIRNRRSGLGDAQPEPTVLLNQAVTLNRDAMAASYGYAKLYGGPVLNSPVLLENIIWKNGGCGLLLHLLDVANDTSSFEKTLELILTCINKSWRLCEDAEKIRAYEIFNVLLRRNSHLITPRSLLALLSAVGIDSTQTDQAALANPFLYRVVLLDFDLWAQTDEQVQVGHLAHLTTLLRTSKHRRFNIKRVAKMQIVKRLLYRLHDLQKPSEALMRQIIDSLRTVLIAVWSESALRAITSYLATKLCRGVQDVKPKRNPQRHATMDTGTTGTSMAHARDRSADETNDLPLRIFELVTSLALDRPNFLVKLGQVINIKWLLLFLHPQSDSRASVLAFEVLASLLVRQPSYVSLLSSAGGWKVLERLVPRFWEEPLVIPMCFSVLFGHQRQPNTRLVHEFGPPKKVHCAPMLRVIINCFKEALAASSGRPDLRKSRPRPSDTLALHPSNSVGSKQKRHARKRSNSMNIDSQSLAESFKENRHQSLVKEIAALIQSHAAQSTAFREALFLPLTLRAIIEAVEPFVEACNSTRGEKTGLNTAEATCDDLLTLLARLSTESMCLTGSTDIVSALMAAIPPRDLAHQGAFRSAITSKILRNAAHQFSGDTSPGLQTASDTSYFALTHFIEEASHDILQGSFFEDALFEATTSVLTRVEKRLRQLDIQDAAAGQEEHRKQLVAAAETLHGSLNRVALYRLSTDNDVLKTLQKLLHHQTLFLGSNTDTVFVQCLANRVLHFLHSSDNADIKQHSWDILKLTVLSQPDVAAAVVPADKQINDILAAQAETVGSLGLFDNGNTDEGPVIPLGPVWQGFLKSAEALQTATHLQRIGQLRQLLDQSDARERAIASTERRMVAWHQSLCATEEDKFSKHLIDVAELQQSASLELCATADVLKGERGILETDTASERAWQLDPLEGPRRMRKRLMEQPKKANADLPKVTEATSTVDENVSPNAAAHGDPWGSADGQLTDEPDAVEAVSTSNEGVSPVAPGSDHAESKGETIAESNASNGVQIDHDDHEHKFRKVLRSLERGDRVEGVVNASRVVGIDCRAALCITGKVCLYLVDDYFQRSNGELVNVWQAPEAERDAHVLAALSSDSDQLSALIADLEGDGQTRKWHWSALRRVHRRFFLHRKTALELFFEDGQSCLLVLPTIAEANALYKVFGTRCRAAIAGAEQMRDGIREPSAPQNEAGRGGGFSARLGAVLGRQSAGVITEAWRQRKISNFDYLMKLNTLAGRSFNDLSQYPVLPWVIADYTSAELDLTKPATFRRLDMPMGAQTQDRREQFEERYESLVEINEPPFHYGTHFSTAATTAGYLIRLRPFDKLLKALQGGSFDLAERTFASIEKAWKSASEVSRGDVRELTPEFFYLPDFLVNTNRFDFGSTQAGLQINDVELPAWAKGDALIFVQKNREALESDYVSENLHHWIDLVFGCKQSGAEAVKALNVFHPLSYAGEVDLEGIQDPDERRAASQTVWNFGVCPSKLFERPHVTRLPEAAPLGLGSTPWLAIENIAPLRTIKTACHFIYAETAEKAYASPADYLILPKLGVSLSTGHLDGSIRMFKSSDPAKAIVVTEQAGVERVLCMTPAGDSVVLTGCRDGLVLVWKVDVGHRELVVEAALRGHTGQVTCLASSQHWRIAVSGSDDATAIVWDTNRASLVRTLRGHNGPVQHIAVDDEEGYIATSAGQEIFLWSMNGSLLAKVSAGSRLSEPVTALSFITKDVHQGGRLALLLTGHRGKVVAWSCEHEGAQLGGPQWMLRPFHIFEHRDRVPTEVGQCNITAIQVTGTNDGQYGRYLFTGDEAGRLKVWTFPGDAFGLPENFTSACMSCEKKWGVLDARRTCRGCGGLFCSSCAEALPRSATARVSEFGSMRFCASCREVCMAMQ